MNPGELNCRITLQKQVKMPDGQGGFETTYTIRTAAWAKISTITAKTKDQYEELVPELIHRIIIRYRCDVAVSDRILFGSRIFEQIGPPINEGERNAFLRLECREVVADSESD